MTSEDEELNTNGIVLAPVKTELVVLLGTEIVAGVLVVDTVPERGALVAVTGIDALDGIDGYSEVTEAVPGSVMFEVGKSEAETGDTGVNDWLPPVPVKVVE